MNDIDLKHRLQAELDALVKKHDDIFGAVLGLTNAGGGFYWAGAAGTAHAGSAQAMQVDTPIFIASITKMYTAAATMILAEQGLLSLDDPLSKTLPASILDGLHVYKGRDYTGRLRVYHLISQTSGLPDYFEEKPRGGKSVLDQILSSGDMAWDVADVARINRSGLTPKFPPEPKEQAISGKKAHYADTNYQLLGAVIEAVAQKPLAQVFSELIIEPLALSSTYLHGHEIPAAVSGKTPATIYYKTRPLHLDKAMTSFGPDGGIVSSVEDSLNFLKCLLAGRLFLHPATLQRMKSWRRIFFPFQYGLGLMRFKLPRIFSPFSAPPELIGHSGASSAFLFYSDTGRLFIGGTLNQLTGQSRPFRLMLKVIQMTAANLE